MNRKFRVLMLSLFAVLFAVSSAFAITADELVVSASDDITPATTEGYNYYQVVYVDTSALTESLDVVSWEIYPETTDTETYNKNLDFLTWTLGSLDVTITGVLPAYDTAEDAINSYLLHVVAHCISGDEHVSADVGTTGLEITVDQGTQAASHDIFLFSKDLVSIDTTSADERGYDKVTDNYSVTITFATTTSKDENGDPLTFVNTALEYDADTKALSDPTVINLPSWLDYEATPFASEDLATYVETLRIYYSSKDVQPVAGEAGSVRITTTLNEAFTETYGKYTTDEGTNLVMGWDTEYYVIPAISLDLVSFDLEAKYGTSADYGVSGDVSSGDYEAYIHYYFHEPVSYVLSPDISADVKVTASFTSLDISGDVATLLASYTSEDKDYGYITFNVEPITPKIASYSTDVIFTDSYDNTAAITLYIDVTMESMEISPVSASISVDVGQTKQLTLTAVNFDGKVVSWDFTAPSGISFDLVSTDSADYSANAVFDVKGVTVGSYSFDVTAVDSSNRSADATVYVVVTPPAPTSFSIRPEAVSASVKVGEATVVSFDAVNNSGDVSWDITGLPAGVTAAPANNALGDKHHAEYRIAASSTAAAGSYKATVTAEDAGGAKATATLNLTVTSASVSAFSISPATSTVSVAAGAAQNVSFTAANNSGLVTWTLGTVPSGMNVATATDTSYATPNMTTMVYTVTGVTAGSTGSVTVTAKDAAGATATATISITVTGSGVGGHEAGDTPAGELTEATKAIVQGLIAQGFLTGDASTGGTLPASAVRYPVISPTAVTISRTGTTSVTRSSDINPIDLVLSFDVDVWRVYVNDSIVAWAYSPGVTPAEFDGEEVSAAAGDHSSNGIEIAADSKREASVMFNPAEMRTGENRIDVAFVQDIDDPTQEIGKTRIATINVSSSTGKTGVGSSSGGCSAGLGALVSVLAAAFFISKKRA